MEFSVESGHSYFDGNLAELIGYRILCYLITVFTFGVAYPWAACMFARWETQHTVVNGRRLTFDGRGGELIGSWLLWILLTFVTCGIFGLWIDIKMKRWIAEHTHFVKSASAPAADEEPSFVPNTHVTPSYAPEPRKPDLMDKLIPKDSIMEKIFPPICWVLSFILTILILYLIFAR